ncbi:molybdate ABC transporter substrate-binding protein [Ruegeria pomeroyi]|uniref:molybdate ABC transporter substrate-binding protein n=1 Tax=Ruegeria pomeroyi TaxID=89184 RepID=UPI001F1E6B2C|nr:molybdate ABC transporter substrate-binding protein [Ruegeria pomeroyi]
MSFSLILRALICALLLAGAARAEQVTVFAAASLKTALDEIAAGFEAATGNTVTLSFAGSSVLARQIGLGAPAQVFISANPEWMDWLADQGRIDPASRRDLVSNRLVLITPAGHASSDPLADLTASTGRIAMALVEAVPAGIYGKAALTHLGLWDQLAPRVVQTDNARAALALVATGAVPYGIVYATDARADPRVTQLLTFATDSHPPILYPAALVAGQENAAARSFLVHLFGAEAQAAFVRHGFLPVED